MTRGRIALVALLVTLAGAAAAWGGLHTQVRLAMWNRIALRALSDGDRARLAECADADWGTLLKVVEQDLDAPCGEPWLVETMAARLEGSQDRVAWLVLRAAGPGHPRQLRAAVVLTISGNGSPVEPLSLLAAADLPPSRVSSLLIAAATGATWGDGLGPRGVALGRAAALEVGRIAPGEALPALAWLSAVGDPIAESAVSRASSSALGVDDTWLASARGRTRADRAPWQVPESWRTILLEREPCPDVACGAVWVALLALPPTTEEEGPVGEVASPPEGDAVLERLARITGAEEDSLAALAWGVDRAVAWVAASPDPPARLRSLLAGSPSSDPAPFARTLWDGAGAPFGVAVVAAAIGRRSGVPVSVRSDGDGVVWIRLGDAPFVGRAGCGGGVYDPPAETEWPAAAVEAAALAELAGRAGADGPRVAAAAARLDPLVGAGLVETFPAPAATRDVQVGREVGAKVVRPLAPPSGAVAERTRYGATGGARCGETVRK